MIRGPPPFKHSNEDAGETSAVQVNACMLYAVQLSYHRSTIDSIRCAVFSLKVVVSTYPGDRSPRYLSLFPSRLNSSSASHTVQPHPQTFSIESQHEHPRIPIPIPVPIPPRRSRASQQLRPNVSAYDIQCRYRGRQISSSFTHLPMCCVLLVPGFFAGLLASSLSLSCSLLTFYHSF